MMSQSFIRVTTSEAVAWAATESLASAETEESIINSAVAAKVDAELHTKLHSHSTYKHGGGLVQLCQIRGCTNVVHFELRGGLCCSCIHHTGELMDSDAKDTSEAEEHIQQSRLKGCIDSATTDKKCCDEHSVHGHNDESLGEKKRALPLPSKSKTKKRKKVDAFVLDVSDVPPQMPILKSKGRIKEGSSKYAGICLDKATNKWRAKIKIEGKPRYIGSYEDEEEAASAYARAVVKYKGHMKPFITQLSDVPPQRPILKSEGYVKDGSSKYAGVSFNKALKKWKAQIQVNGKQSCIGHYENEEEAAVDYARAVFKYKKQKDKEVEKEVKDASKILIHICEASTSQVVSSLLR